MIRILIKSILVLFLSSSCANLLHAQSRRIDSVLVVFDKNVSLGKFKMSMSTTTDYKNQRIITLAFADTINKEPVSNTFFMQLVLLENNEMVIKTLPHLPVLFMSEFAANADKNPGWFRFKRFLLLSNITGTANWYRVETAETFWHSTNHGEN